MKPDRAPESEARDRAMRAAARRAADLVVEGQLVGLGTGRTMRHVIVALGERCQRGLRFTGVATSADTAAIARAHGIPLVDFAAAPRVDLAIDGADEIDPDLRLIKGRGGALVREKLVAAASARFVVVADESKLVDLLGSRSPLPVAVVPFGWRYVQEALGRLGRPAELRRTAEGLFITDDGLAILDCAPAPIPDPERLADDLDATVGIVEHGLFLGMAEAAIIGDARGGSRVIQRPNSTWSS